MSFGMTEGNQMRANDYNIDGNAKEMNAVQHDAEETTSGYDDFCLLTSTIIELDPKDVLIVKDGTVRVAESLDREQLDANGKAVMASGSWTKIEHERFLRAMKTFPKGPWKAIAEMVATRTVRQTQTHAQKYREKLARRMRGLRNRNGTLQNPPMAGMAGYPNYIVPPYTNMHGHGYQHAAHFGETGYASTATLARASSLPSMPLHSLPLHHNHTPYVSAAMPVSIAMVSSAFSQMSTSTTSSAVIENATYPLSWETNVADNKQTVPDFDESMDFLMDVYSTNPNQINTVMPSQSIGTTVTPTACIPRAPPTPMSSLAMKRHPGYGFIQEQRSIPATQGNPTTRMSSSNVATPRAAPQRLTLEEKVWFDRRRKDIEYCSGVGGAVGAAITAAITTLGPFPRRVQFFAIAGGVVIGGGAGYLYADNKALERVQDLSASSNLRKQYLQIEMEKKATKTSK